MKKIVYLNNYMSNEIVEERKNHAIFSQPANNKVEGILLSLEAVGCHVTILSSGLVNAKSGKWYKREEGKRFHSADVVYCGLFDFPFLNTLTSIMSMYSEIKRINRKSKIDNIVFYNYKPEVAWAAYLARVFLKIPITVEYEDGYSHVEEIRGFKAIIFNYTEKIVSKYIDSAVVVNDTIRKKYQVPSVTVRGVVNPGFYSKCREYKKIRNDKFTILYSGGLDKSRGIQVLLESLKYIDFDCHVVITGKGKLTVGDTRVDFKGFIPYEEALYWMQQADILVQCQLVGDEFANVSFPSKLFEYIATGNAIISSNLLDVIAFAADNINYYMNDNPILLANEIKKLYEQWKSGMDISEKVISLCEQNLPQNVGRRIIDVLGGK